MRHAPRRESPKLGYLRAGARVKRSEAAAGHTGCEGGWYRVSPMGYVCVGVEAVLDSDDAKAQPLPVSPDRDAPLPYMYARARNPAPLKYVRVPNRQQRRRYEVANVPSSVTPASWKERRFTPVPDFLREGGAAPTLRGYDYGRQTLYLERALAGSGFALHELFRANGGSFGLSVDREVLALDRLEPVTGSEFEGIRVQESRAVAVAFVKSARAAVFVRAAEPAAGFVERGQALRREGFCLTEGKVRWGARELVEAVDGTWLDSAQLLIVSARERPPREVARGGTWIDVSLRDQTLVAYEGSRAVYATLVSTGVKGEEDAEDSLETPTGLYRVHTKHVTTTMSGNAPDDPYSMGHVPWVQYFEGNYALHGAYWHDSFGRPKSHGCVNLSPADALWLFKWSSPPVPRAWHGAMSTDGTLVRIRS